jgi:hypothetical protein
MFETETWYVGTKSETWAVADRLGGELRGLPHPRLSLSKFFITKLLHFLSLVEIVSVYGDLESFFHHLVQCN